MTFRDTSTLKTSYLFIFLKKRNTIGLFGDLSFEYDNFLYLSLSGRNDWISNLIAENNSQFYPSVSASFIPTSAFEGFGGGNSLGLNYLKLRAGLDHLQDSLAATLR